MAIVIAFIGQVYRISSVKSNAWFQKINNRFVRLLVGFGIAGLVALIVYYVTHTLELTEHGLELVLGSGESMVNMAFAGQVTLAMALIGLVAKMIATLACWYLAYFLAPWLRPLLPNSLTMSRCCSLFLHCQAA